MKGKYFAAAGIAAVGIAVYSYLKNRKPQAVQQPLKESERHHLTNAFARAKQVAVGK